MDEEAIRRDFEVWATMKNYSLRCSESPHKYIYPDTQSAWDSWAESARRGDKRVKGDVIKLLQNDAFAMSFQSFGQYRSAVIKAIRATIPE